MALIFAGCPSAPFDVPTQVRAIERPHDPQRPLQRKHIQNVLPHSRRGGRRKSHHRRGEPAAKHAQTTIRGPEVMPPL